MVTETKTKVKGKPWSQLRPRIQRIKADAKSLGVTRQHLYLVLNDLRESKPLLRRYRELKRLQKRGAIG